DQPAAREHVDAGQELGDRDRRAIGQDHDARAEGDAPGDAGEPWQHGERVQHVLAVDDLHVLRHDDVIGHPYGVEAGRLGVLAGPLRTVPFRALRALATFYVEFFRNVPLLVWMFFWYFGVPPLLPQGAQQWLFAHGAEFWAGMFALGVYHGARMSEVIRS